MQALAGTMDSQAAGAIAGAKGAGGNAPGGGEAGGGKGAN